MEVTWVAVMMDLSLTESSFSDSYNAIRVFGVGTKEQMLKIAKMCVGSLERVRGLDNSADKARAELDRDGWCEFLDHMIGVKPAKQLAEWEDPDNLRQALGLPPSD